MAKKKRDEMEETALDEMEATDPEGAEVQAQSDDDVASILETSPEDLVAQISQELDELDPAELQVQIRQSQSVGKDRKSTSRIRRSARSTTRRPKNLVKPITPSTSSARKCRRR